MSGRLSQFHFGERGGLGMGMGKKGKRKRKRNQGGWPPPRNYTLIPLFGLCAWFVFLFCFLFSLAFCSFPETMERRRNGRPGLMEGRHRSRRRFSDGC